MSFSINTNTASLQAQNYLQTNSNFQGKTINRVTSGLRIIQSGDDAAGLAIANGYRSDEAVLTQGIRNANDGLSQLQIIDGGINNISQLLDRARTLATQSATGTFTGDRSLLNSEFQNVLGEIDRQSQSIGLNTNGVFAKNLSVFIGGGKGATQSGAVNNGSVGLDLSQSTVDSKSLGLQGVQSIGKAGTDIGTGSVKTSVANIVGNLANATSQSVSGYTSFEFRGPGFGDGNGVKVSVNLAGVTDASTLVAAINSAIKTAGAAGTQAGTAFNNANITAGTSVDANGKTQLTFNSASAAFQVQAGDKTSNALLGNFAPLNASVAGSGKYATLDTTAGAGYQSLSFNFDGSATTHTVNLGTTNAALGKQAIVDVLNQDHSNFSPFATASLNDQNQIVITSNTNGSSSSVKVDFNAASDSLGLTNGANVTGAAASAATGAATTTTVLGSAAAATGTTTFGSAGAGTITFRFSGASLSSAVDVQLTTTAGETVQTAVSALQSAVAGSSALKGAGISLNTPTLDGSNGLLFTSTSGESFKVDVSGDVTNKLGFGSFQTGANGVFDYGSSTATGNYTAGTSAVNTGAAAGNANFEFSIAGAASNGVAAGAFSKINVDLTGGNATAAIAIGSSAPVNPVDVTANNNVLDLKVNGTSYKVTLAAGSTTLESVASQINSVIGAVSGGGAGVGTATVDKDGKLEIASTLKGAGASVDIQAGLTNSAAGLLGLATGPTYGTSRTGADLASLLNQQFASSSALSNAGLQADFGTTVTGRLTITSTNGTNFRLNTYTDGATATSASVTGTAGSSTALSAVSTSSHNFATPLVVDGTNDTLTVNNDGGGMNTLTLTHGSYASAALLATQINLDGAAAAPGAWASTASADASGHLQIASNSALGSGSTQVLGGNATTGGAGIGLTAGTTAGKDNVTTAAIAGFQEGTAVTNASLDFSTNKVLNVVVDGGATQAITLADQGAGLNTLANVVKQINTQLVGATASIGTGNKLLITSNSGSAGKVDTAAGSTAADTAANAGLNFGVAGGTVGSVGTAAAATNKFAVATGTSDQLSITVDGQATPQVVTLTGGGTQTGASVVSDINGQLTGATASLDKFGHVQITSNSTGVNSSVSLNAVANDAYSALGLSAGTTAAKIADVGYGSTGVTFGGNKVSAAPLSGAQVDAGGASQSTAINYASIVNGSDAQALTITANDAGGSSQSLTLTLANDATSRTGRSIDETLNYINTTLQQSNNSTLQGIVAVKEDNVVNGKATEQIKFLSTDASFKVSIGTNGDTSGLTSLAADGVTKTQGTTISSALAAGGGTADISNQSSAASAVSALAAAVANLGKAQAVVGRGQNQFGYAVNLAQSQLTNLATAESRIRDADLATEAANLTKAQVLIQAGVAALAQANSAPQQVLTLLRG